MIELRIKCTELKEIDSFLIQLQMLKTFKKVNGKTNVFLCRDNKYRAFMNLEPLTRLNKLEMIKLAENTKIGLSKQKPIKTKRGRKSKHDILD